MSEDLKAKLQQFLAEEVELLEDFTLDMEECEEGNNKSYAKAVSLWAMQTTRVSAIRDTLGLLNIKDIKNN